MYPQLFIIRADGDTKFIGDFDTINVRGRVEGSGRRKRVRGTGIDCDPRILSRLQEMNESETLSAALFEAPRDATQA